MSCGDIELQRMTWVETDNVQQQKKCSVVAGNASQFEILVRDILLVHSCNQIYSNMIKYGAKYSEAT